METTIITGRVTAPRPTGGLVGRARVVSACVAAAFAVIFGHALLTSSRSVVSTAQQSARTWARVPAGAREAISRDLGAREARFLVTRTRSGLVARSSGLQATFGRRGSSRSRWRWSVIATWTRGCRAGTLTHADDTCFSHRQGKHRELCPRRHRGVVRKRTARARARLHGQRPHAWDW